MAISSAIPSQQTNLNPSPRSQNLPSNRPTQHQRSRSNIRPLHHYTISELKANLFKNEQFLKSSDRVNSLPDKGAKLIEANSKIREVIRLKLECEARGVPYPGTGTDLGPDQFPSMKNKQYGSQMGGVSDMGQQFEKMNLSKGSLSSASLSSSFSRSGSVDSFTPPGPSPVSSRESLPKRSPRPPGHSGSPNSLKHPNIRQHQRTYSDSPHSSSGKHKKSGSVPPSPKASKSAEDPELPKPAQSSSLSPGLLQFLQIQKGLQMEREKRLKDEEDGRGDPVKQSSRGNNDQASIASNSTRSSTQKLPVSKRPTFQYFEEFLDEDSDDFDGFSEEEYY